MSVAKTFISSKWILLKSKPSSREVIGFQFCSCRIKERLSIVASLNGMLKRDEFFKNGVNRATILNSEDVRLLSFAFDRREISAPWVQLKEKIISDYMGLALYKNSFMYELINRKVVQFMESGLAQSLVDSYRYIKKHADKIEPNVLTLEHLQAGFYVWLACIVVSLIAFIMEICFSRLDKWMRSLLRGGL